MGTPNSESLTIIEKLERLLPGESIIYHTGRTGWLDGNMTYLPLLRWSVRAQASGRWTFVQRKVGYDTTTGLSVFEYIAILLKDPLPPDENYVYTNRLSPIK